MKMELLVQDLHNYFSITVNGNIDPEPTISNYNGFQISCFEANDGFINLRSCGWYS